MRRLTKGPPPENVSPLKQEPATLAAWGASCAAGLTSIVGDEARTAHARSQFNQMHKPTLRAELFKEQHYLCVFCEREIAEGPRTLSIDHWHPLSKFLEHTFTWDNLHISCDFDDTCDKRKKDDPLNLPWPVAFHYEDVLGFTSGGRMYVRTDVSMTSALRAALAIALEDQPGPPSIKSTLNLNHPALREARRAAIEAEEEAIEASPSMTADDRRERVVAMLAKAQREQFISARVAVWNGELGVGR